jgi:hypothetical protein
MHMVDERDGNRKNVNTIAAGPRPVTGVVASCSAVHELQEPQVDSPLAFGTTAFCMAASAGDGVHVTEVGVGVAADCDPFDAIDAARRRGKSMSC